MNNLQQNQKNKTITYEVNNEAVELSPKIVRDFLARGNADITDQEIVMFINLCKYQKLNPFLNEAYLIKFKAKESKWQQPAQIIVSKEAFMKRAENHPKYKGFEAGVIVERNGELIEIEGAIKLANDTLIGGWAKVYRSDRDKPIVAKISIDEFSKGQSTWNSMPLSMIRKSAIVNAQREAFPETLGAMYTEEEQRDVVEVDNVETEVRQEIENNAHQEVLEMPQKEVVTQEENIIDEEGPAF